MTGQQIDAAVAAAPGSPEWELELCRREVSEAGRRVREAENELSRRVRELEAVAVRYGRADEAVRAAGLGEQP
jgi:hypothetical protein